LQTPRSFAPGLQARLKVVLSRESSKSALPYRTTSVLRPFAVGALVFILGLSANWLSQNALSSRWHILDDLILGATAGLIVLWYERLRTRALLQRLLIIREMNHHVRNALQVVIYAASAHKDEDLAEQVRDAVRRIDWALNEVLPELKEKPADDR
jgi:two-component sensor histidine kinase